MRKAISVALALGLLVGAFVGTAEAGKKKKKKPAPAPVVKVEEVIELAYSGGDLGVMTPAASQTACFVDPSMPFACKSVTPVTEGMKYIKIEVADSSGQKVGGFISQQDADGDGLGDGYGKFCGAHAESIPLEVESGKVDIAMAIGSCDDGTPSIVTTGTIKVTFSNLP